MQTMGMRREKAYYVEFTSAEDRAFSYAFKAPSRRRARADAREWAARTGATFRAIEPPQHTNARRLLAIAGITATASSISIVVTMLIALRLEAAL